MEQKDHYADDGFGRLYPLWRKINFPWQYKKIITDAAASLDLKKGDKVLDVACGPGYNFQNLAQHVGQEGSITALDFSGHMLSLARERAASLEIKNVTFLQGDAAKLQTEEQFDAAIIVLGLSVIPEWKIALKKVVDSVKPGGRIAVVDDQLIEGGFSILNPILRIVHKMVAAEVRDIVGETRKLLRKPTLQSYPFSTKFVLSGKVQE